MHLARLHNERGNHDVSAALTPIIPGNHPEPLHPGNISLRD
jgi:hypothetical protein